ncbi:MAG: VOC family protein [Steroidobacteraceae bacterium]
MKLRSVELQMPADEIDAAAEFLTKTWRVVPVEHTGSTQYFRGSGEHPYLLAIAKANAPGVSSVSFLVNEQELAALEQRAKQAGVAFTKIAAFDEPGGGHGLLIRGPENQTYRFCVNGPAPAIATNADTPVQLTHAVININDLPRSEAFATDVLGFRISDRTRIMTFVRCNQKHHCVAYAPAEVPSLNHIAFEMQDADAVMRGIGRMRDAGFACSWGPGRHGPGDNVFAYFIAPFGAVIEYTAEVSEVDDNYKVGAPSDWTWPPGRIDQWGLSTKDIPNIVAAEKRFRFLPA